MTLLRAQEFTLHLLHGLMDYLTGDFMHLLHGLMDYLTGDFSVFSTD